MKCPWCDFESEETLLDSYDKKTLLLNVAWRKHFINSHGVKDNPKELKEKVNEIIKKYAN